MKKKGMKSPARRKSGTTSTLIARNFVAKHAPRCGAGSHIDRKKAQKFGYRKHKNDY